MTYCQVPFLDGLGSISEIKDMFSAEVYSYSISCLSFTEPSSYLESCFLLDLPE